MKGFGPFRDTTVVDFADVDLVALVGPTGAGKSSVIDAITFALYGSVIRYDNAAAVAPVVNQLSTEARVLLDFEVEGTAYRVIRVVRRTEKGATTREARLERGDTVLAGRAGEVGPAIESLLGLDLDRFNRTVVLPQGRFATFLHDKPADRQEVLRRLLDLSVYTRMGTSARDSARTAQAQLDVLEPLRGDIPTDADIIGLRHEAEAVTQTAEAVRVRVDDHARAAADLHSLEREAHDLGVLALAFAGCEVPDGIDELAEARATAEAARDAAKRWLEQARAAFDAAVSAVENGPNVDIATRLLADHDELERATAMLVEMDIAFGASEAALAAATEAADAARTRLATLDAAADAARVALDEARHAQESGPDAAALASVARRRDELVAARAEVTERAAALAGATATHAAAVTAHADRQQRVAAAAEVVEAARARAGAAGLLAGLDVGDACPVCRRPIDELPDHDVDAELAAAAQRHQDEVDALASLRSALDTALEDRSGADADHRSAQASVDRLEADLADAPDADAIAAAIALAGELAAATAAAASARTDAEAARRAGQRDPAIQGALANERSAIDAHGEVVRRRDQAVTRVDGCHARLVDAPDVDTLRNDITIAEALLATRARSRTALAEADAAVARATEALQAIIERDDRARRVLNQTRDRFVALGAPAVEGTLADGWSTLVRWAGERADEAMTAHREAVDRAAVARAELDDAAVEIRALASPWMAAAELDDDAPLSALREALAVASTRAQVAVDTAVDRQAEARRRDAEITVLRERTDVDGELGRLLDATGFERWLMAEAVEDLVARATERLLELSRGQYSLVAQGTEFGICDHRNADELRDAKTLSGGETFLASLALALALAESIAELAADGAPGMGALFLDEGFGTLDPETLDVVASAIEELGASGRMVGVVTHIRELAERMPVRFEVAKGPTTSTVERVSGR